MVDTIGLSDINNEPITNLIIVKLPAYIAEMHQSRRNDCLLKSNHEPDKTNRDDIPEQLSNGRGLSKIFANIKESSD